MMSEDDIFGDSRLARVERALEKLKLYMDARRSISDIEAELKALGIDPIEERRRAREQLKMLRALAEERGTSGVNVKTSEKIVSFLENFVPSKIEAESVSRREFLGKAAALGFLAFSHKTAASLGLISIPATNAPCLSDEIVPSEAFDKDIDESLLQRFFAFEKSESGLLIPSRNYEGKQLPIGEGFWPNEKACCVAFKQRLLPDARIEGIDREPEERNDQSLFVFGSQISNAFAREIFGNPKLEEPKFTVERKEWRTYLRWNLHSPPGAEERRRTQYGKPWVFKHHRFAVRQSNAIFKSELVTSDTGDDIQKDDYLLVTVIPRSTGTQRIVLVGGLHAAGTAAVKNLLAQPPIRELENALKKAGQLPYYQALFHVSVGYEPPNTEGFPIRVELVDAVPLEIEWAKR